MGVAFRELPIGAPGGDYLSRAIVDCRGAPTDIAFTGLTSCRWITIAGTLAHRRVALERAADRYTLICDEPLNVRNGSVAGSATGTARVSASAGG
jgi:hypothetical protein